MKFKFGFVAIEVGGRRKPPSRPLTNEDRLGRALQAATWMLDRGCQGKTWSRRSRPRWMTEAAWGSGYRLLHTAGVLYRGTWARRPWEKQAMVNRLHAKVEYYRKEMQNPRYVLPL